MKIAALMLAAVLCAAPQADAQSEVSSRSPAADASQDKPQEKPEERSTGLPRWIDWTFNLDASWGTFGFANSLYQFPKEGVSENLSDQWFEGYVKPALSWRHRLASSSEVYGKLSAIGARTYGAAPNLVGSDYSSFQFEDLAVGWRSGQALERLGDNALDFSVGRLPYSIGHGLLLYEGGADGGSRGAYWTSPRKAFQFGAVARFKPRHHKLEAFYLDRDELPEKDTGTRLWGTNYEFTPDEHTLLGVAYMKFFAHTDAAPQRDGLNVFNLRAYTAPIPSARDLSFEFEYASERNGDLLHSNAWTLKGIYELSGLNWKPRLSYRYASFQGDKPDTSRNERFDSLLPGFTDWGNWFQGEIAGEYFLANSNLNSHQIRAHVTPSEKLDGGMIFYRFSLDQLRSFIPIVTDKHLAAELDTYVEWKLNQAFTASFVLAFANPGEAVRQAFNRTKPFTYGMFMIAYSY
jgi:hypothetical protein